MEEISRHVRLIRQAWIPHLTDKNDRIREAIVRTFEALEGIENEIINKPAAAGRNPGPAQEGGAAEYAVLTAEDGECLAEFHGQNKYPYRVSATIYQAVARVLDQHQPLFFEDLKKMVEEKLRQELSEYLVRVPLRLWMREGLVDRKSRKYAASDGVKLMESAKQAWAALPSRHG